MALTGRELVDAFQVRQGGGQESQGRIHRPWRLSATLADQAQALTDRLNSVGLTFPGRQFHALSEAPSPEEACLAAAWAITLTRRSRTTLPWMT